MGPTTWTQMDSRPDVGEHQMDWDKNVGPYVQSVSEPTYWRRNKDVTYRPEGASAFTKSRGRYTYVKPGQMARYIDLMKQVSAVYKQKKYSGSFSLDIRQGASQGPHAVTFTDFAKWSFFDEPANFRKDYEEVHGAASFDRFLEDLEACTIRSKTYDVLSELAADLGG